MRVLLALFAVAVVACFGETTLLDQVAVVVNGSIIKDSDIRRDISLTNFLDNQPLRMSAEQKKQAAGRLIDQALLRQEIENGGYPQAAAPEVNAALANMVRTRFHSAADLQEALKKYQLDEATLRKRLGWQLTVLRFIDARFKADATVQNSAGAADEVNRLLDLWLQQRRKQSKITFLEGGLQ